MKKVGMIRRAGIVLLMSLLLAGLSDAVDMNPGKYALEHTHQFQQDVSGEGFVMVYQDVNTNNLSLKNYMHGSGIMDMATLINSEQKSRRTTTAVTSTGLWKDEKADDSKISFTEQNEMSYAPFSFNYVTGWYADHPVVYKSALKERTDSKNFQAGVAMVHQIEYARAFKKDIGITLNCTGAGISTKGVGQAIMKIDEEVTQGNVHIGELLTRPSSKTSKSGTTKQGGKGEALVTVDENYIGNFKIKKNIDINVPKSAIYDSSDWLPCCIGGFFDMTTWEQKVMKSTTGIFDCSCRETALKTYKPEWNASKAQFPTIEYQKKA